MNTKILVSTFAIAATLLTSSFTLQAETIIAKAEEQQFDSVVKATDGTLKQTQEAISQHNLATTKSRVETTSYESEDFWIYDAWVTLYEDPDYDGYYSRFGVEFDADTVYSSAPVYAAIYLGRGDHFELLHTTSNFSIYGDDSNDSFVVNSDLVSGFVPRDYEILIEIYDAYTDELVAYADGYSDADLAYVSLESQNYEYTQEETVVIVQEYGGSLMYSGLLAMLGMIVWRRRK